MYASVPRSGSRTLLGLMLACAVLQTVLIKPEELAAHGITVQKVVQHPGDFIINFPGWNLCSMHQYHIALSCGCISQEFGNDGCAQHHCQALVHWHNPSSVAL